MTAKARNVLRTSDAESAKPELVPIGTRLAEVRAQSGLTQVAFATSLGVPHKSYVRWERGIREITVEGFNTLIGRGWNANWLITGEGPERLSQLQVAEGHAGYASQPMRGELLKLCIEAIDGELQDARRVLPAEKRAMAYTLAYEILLETGESLPVAKVAQMAIRAALA